LRRGLAVYTNLPNLQGQGLGRLLLAEDMGDLKRPMSGLEQGMTLVKREINLSKETCARQQITLNKLAERIGRIECRLELS